VKLEDPLAWTPDLKVLEFREARPEDQKRSANGPKSSRNMLGERDLGKPKSENWSIRPALRLDHSRQQGGKSI
jgi:hypothetical protein